MSKTLHNHCVHKCVTISLHISDTNLNTQAFSSPCILSSKDPPNIANYWEKFLFYTCHLVI